MDPGTQGPAPLPGSHMVKLMTKIYQTYNGNEKWIEAHQKFVLTM